MVWLVVGVVVVVGLVVALRYHRDQGVYKYIEPTQCVTNCHFNTAVNCFGSDNPGQCVEAGLHRCLGQCPGGS